MAFFVLSQHTRTHTHTHTRTHAHTHTRKYANTHSVCLWAKAYRQHHRQSLHGAPEELGPTEHAGSYCCPQFQYRHFYAATGILLQSRSPKLLLRKRNREEVSTAPSKLHYGLSKAPSENNIALAVLTEDILVGSLREVGSLFILR